MTFVWLQDFQRALGAKQPLYDNIVRSGRGLRDKSNPTDTKTINGMLTDLKDKWDLVCSKSVDRWSNEEQAYLVYWQSLLLITHFSAKNIVHMS